MIYAITYVMFGDHLQYFATNIGIWHKQVEAGQVVLNIFGSCCEYLKCSEPVLIYTFHWRYLSWYMECYTVNIECKR